MYYIEKMGVYGQGVFWIGADVDEGRTVLQTLADADTDNYHTWSLYEYSPDSLDPRSEPVAYLEKGGEVYTEKEVYQYTPPTVTINWTTLGKD